MSPDAEAIRADIRRQLAEAPDGVSAAKDYCDGFASGLIAALQSFDAYELEADLQSFLEDPQPGFSVKVPDDTSVEGATLTLAANMRPTPEMTAKVKDYNTVLRQTRREVSTPPRFALPSLLLLVIFAAIGIVQVINWIV